MNKKLKCIATKKKNAKSKKRFKATISPTAAKDKKWCWKGLAFVTSRKNIVDVIA